MPRRRRESEDGEEEEQEETPTTKGEVDMDEVVENMLESRYTTRETALATFHRGLALNYSYDFVEKWSTTINEGLKKSFKQGREKEYELAAGALGILAITLGADASSLFSEFSPLLATNVKSGSSAKVVGQSAMALSMLCFLGCTNELDTKAQLELFQSALKSAHPESKAMLLKSWALLITTLSASYLRSIFSDVVQIFYGLLDADNLELRTTAAETIALVFDILREQDEDNGDEFSVDNYRGEIDTDELLEKVSEMTHGQNKFLSKKDKQKQKNTLKDVLQLLQNGETVSERLNISGQDLYFESWTEITQLNSLREYLRGGTLTHFQENPLLGEIFDFRLEKGAPPVRLSRLEKRFLKSPSSAASKARTKGLASARAAHGRQEAAVAFYKDF